MQLNDPVHRYHKLLEKNQFRDLAWAEELHQSMRSAGLADSGRVIAPILRPFFLTKSQADGLAEACSRVASLFEQAEGHVCESPALLQRLRMLPAEKVIACEPCGHTQSTLVSSMEVLFRNGSFQIAAVETGRPAGLGYSQALADLFQRMPVAVELARSGFAVSRLGCEQALLPSVRRFWKRYKPNATQPRIAVVDAHSRLNNGTTEGHLLAASLSDRNGDAKLFTPEQVDYNKGVLHAGGEPVDVVFRRFDTRDLLMRSDLTHPLLRAYREHATCNVNGFRSEVSRKRTLFELLTDGTLAGRLSALDRDTVQRFIPWTRTLTNCRTTYRDQEIDLLPFASKNRERMLLRPAEDGLGKQSYSGCACDAHVWDRALHAAVQQQYVIQERPPGRTELFPLLQYGDLQMKQLQITLHAHVIEGELRGALAQLDLPCSEFARPVALAPVFIAEKAAAEKTG